MIFNSVTFLVFLGITVCLYWCLPYKPRLWLIFSSSLVFYGFWRWEFLPVMLVSTVTDYAAARAIDASSNAARRRVYLGLSLFVNLGLLFYFKYLMFFAENVTGLARLMGFDVPNPQLTIILPLGISFYTFQTISYSVDVYRGFIRPERDFVLYACYVTYFPQLVAGPILRAREVIHQFRHRPPFRLDSLRTGLRRIAFGLFLKVVLADNLAPLVDEGFATDVSLLSAVDVWTLAFLFGFQIYFDFSAYSHIAIGCARLMGINFPENFNFPYLATSPRDFWKRWHISLSSWIRDYLYLPLTGARVDDRSVGGLAVAVDERRRRDQRTRALFLTWGIMGLWHGANWTFVFWGLYHALLVYGYRRSSPYAAALPERLRTLGGFAVTLCLAMLGWIPFRAGSLGDAIVMLARVFVPWQYDSLGLRENTYLVAALVLVSMLAAAWAHSLAPHLERRPPLWFAAQVAGYAVIVALVFVFLRPINQFIYFQF